MKEVSLEVLETAAQSLAKELYSYSGGTRRVVIIVEGSNGDCKGTILESYCSVFYHPEELQSGADIYIKLSPSMFLASKGKKQIETIWRGAGYMELAHQLHVEQYGERCKVENVQLENLVSLLERERVLRLAQGNKNNAPAKLMRSLALWQRAIDSSLEGYDRDLNQFGFALQDKPDFNLSKQVEAALALVPDNLLPDSNDALVKLALNIYQRLTDDAETKGSTHACEAIVHGPKALKMADFANPSEIPLSALVDEQQRLEKAVEHVYFGVTVGNHMTTVGVRQRISAQFDSFAKELSAALQAEQNGETEELLWRKKISLGLVCELINSLGVTAWFGCGCAQKYDLGTKNHFAGCWQARPKDSSLPKRGRINCGCPPVSPPGFKDGHHFGCPNSKDPFGCHENVVQHSIVSNCKLLRRASGIIAPDQSRKPELVNSASAGVAAYDELSYARKCAEWLKANRPKIVAQWATHMAMLDLQEHWFNLEKGFSEGAADHGNPGEKLYHASLAIEHIDTISRLSNLALPERT